MGEIELNLERKSGILFLGIFHESAIVLKNVTTVTMGEIHHCSDSEYTVLVDGIVVYTSDDYAKVEYVKGEILRILSDYCQQFAMGENMKEVKVGQKYKQRGCNAFGIVKQVDKGGYVFISDCLSDKMFAFEYQEFIDGFELVAEKSRKKEDFHKNFSLNLLFSLFVLLAVLAIFALCQYIGFDALVVLISMFVVSAVLGFWESYKS